jgi:hypothetical protein
MFIALLVCFLALVEFDLTFDVSIVEQRMLIFFIASTVISAIPCVFLYFGSHTLYASRRTKDKPVSRAVAGNFVKTSMLGAVGILALIGGVVLISAYNSYLVAGNIDGGNGHNDGPWLTWHSDPKTSVCITWLTANKNSTVVRYGTTPAALDSIYTDQNPVFLHKVYLDGLIPDTTYFYRIPESFEVIHSSSLFNFTTAPASARPFKFAVFGDKQPDSETSDLMRTNMIVTDGLLSRNVDFALQIGDIASSGSDVEDWHLALTSLAKLGAHVPIQAAIGNHDWAGMAGSTNWGRLFSYPYAGTNLARYYSFDYLNAHFTIIDNFERLYAMSEKQIRWIESDIMSAKARGQDWIFCLFHLSLMTTATSGMFQALQRQLVPIFDRLNVDAVFYGHDHDYEHYNYTYGWNGLVYEPEDSWIHNHVQYFCTGGGGANLEVGYGILDQSVTLDTVHWWNTTAGTYQDATYERRPWNASRYVSNPGFSTNFTQYDPSGAHDGKYYYHYPGHQVYHDEAIQLGYDYGEQCYHFMEIAIDGSTCNITALYPNGVMLSGPGHVTPQTWVLTK